MTETIQHEDGRVELNADALEDIEASPLYNEDLAPVPVEKRNWTTYNYAALWISMAHCIPTYMMASGLISAGMNWWQALFTILLGNMIVLAPILLNSHPGTKYGIPFPVFARAAYGTFGSNLPAFMRAIVACGWFGIQAWIGGQAMHTFFAAFIPGWATLLGGPIGGHTPTEWLSFLMFWAMNILIIYRGMDLLRIVENWAAPYVLVMTAVLLAWILYQAGGVGFLLHEPGKFQYVRRVLADIHPIADGDDRILGDALPQHAGLYAVRQKPARTGRRPDGRAADDDGRFCGDGNFDHFGRGRGFPEMNPADAWDPVKLVGQFSQPLVVAISMFTVVVATLSVNIAANVVSPANDFANAFPKCISFRTGGLITGIIGILMQPWKLLADPSGYIFGWLVGYSGGLGSIAGVLIADYWLVRRKDLNLGDLYRSKGDLRRLELAGRIATLLGCFFAWIGLIIPILRPLYDYAWFVGFGVAFGVHFALMRTPPPRDRSEVVQ